MNVQNQNWFNSAQFNSYRTIHIAELNENELASHARMVHMASSVQFSTFQSWQRQRTLILLMVCELCPVFPFCLSSILTGRFPGEPGLVSFASVFFHHLLQRRTFWEQVAEVFTAQVPFLLRNQNCESTEGNIALHL